jgi:hypothetical protein
MLKNVRREHSDFESNARSGTKPDLRKLLPHLDAPDLGFRNRRFQNVPFRFKRQSIYEGKTRFFTFRVAFTIGE